MAEIPVMKGRKSIPNFTDSEDQVLAMILALTSELAVTRERLDTLERILGEQNLLDSSAIDSFVPDQTAAAKRDALRRRIISKVMQPVNDAARRAADDKQNLPSQEV